MDRAFTILYYRVILLTIILLNAIDAVTTLYGIQLTYHLIGTAGEINPICRWLLDQGPLSFLVIKVGIISLILLFLYSRLVQNRMRPSKTTTVILTVTAALISLVVYSNTVQIVLLHLYTT